LGSVVRALVLADTHVGEGSTRQLPDQVWAAMRVVIFGHSHMPYNRWVDRQLLFNPGSSTWKRTAPTHTYGVLEFAAGEVVRHEIVAVAQRTA